MGGVERREVVIVGSGPAGSATAVALATTTPACAPDVLMLERASHPRHKTCAGGIIPKGERLLRRFDIDLAVPHARVDRARVWVPHARVDVPGRDLCRVVRRDLFDAMLADAARERGIELRERTIVRDVRREGDRIRVQTDAGDVLARVVVGADGSGSLVRRRLLPGGGDMARAVMCDVPLAGLGWDGHAAARYEFDFRPTLQGLRGYAWAFPCVIDATAHVNVGAYGLPPVSGTRLRAAMAAQLARLGASEPARWRAAPIHTYRRGTRVAGPNALLVGDAAGAEALLGEGISFAIEYGVLAAEAIAGARASGGWDFERYQRAIERGPIGRKLARLSWAADRFYGRRSRQWFALARTSRRAQRLALGWYNGVEDVDGQSRTGLLWAMVRGVDPQRA